MKPCGMIAAATAFAMLGALSGAMPAMAEPGSPAADSGPVLLDGALAHPGAVDANLLARLPHASLPVVYGTGKGVRSGRYDGVLLWDLLQQAGPKDEAGKHTALRHTLLVTGHDGYEVAFSFGELDPAAGADPVLLVTTPGDGASLIVPGDRTGARDVHDVARISVR